MFTSYLLLLYLSTFIFDVNGKVEKPHFIHFIFNYYTHSYSHSILGYIFGFTSLSLYREYKNSK